MRPGAGGTSRTPRCTAGYGEGRPYLPPVSGGPTCPGILQGRPGTQQLSPETYLPYRSHPQDTSVQDNRISPAFERRASRGNQISLVRQRHIVIKIVLVDTFE